MYKAVILDFDGVILDSVQAKGRAFVRLFSEYPQHAGAIAAFHDANGGLNRVPKIRAICQTIIGRQIDEQELALLCDRFADLAAEELEQAGFVPGALEFITNNSQQYNLAVVSATPHEELQRIVAERGIANCFRLVLGAPPGKAENLGIALRTLGILAQDACFVGDALADFEGAQAVGIPFVGRVGDPATSPFRGMTIPLIPDLMALAALLGGQP